MKGHFKNIYFKVGNQKVIDIGDLSWVEIDDELDFQRAQLKFEIQ